MLEVIRLNNHQAMIWNKRYPNGGRLDAKDQPKAPHTHAEAFGRWFYRPSRSSQYLINCLKENGGGTPMEQ
jgi:hypothetical protein